MSQERFESSLRFVLRWEGSVFTDHPADNGGPTRFGIIQQEYDAFRRRQGRSTQSVRFITMDEVRTIYTRQYWNVVESDNAPAPIDLILFDTGVLMGTGRAIRFLQSALGVGVDGDLGPQTRAALRQVASQGSQRIHALAIRLLNLRENRLRGIVAANPSQRVFLRGWLNRLNDLRQTVGVPVPETAEAIVALPENDDETRSTDDTATGAPDPTGRADMELPDDGEGTDVGSSSRNTVTSGGTAYPPTVFVASVRERLQRLTGPGTVILTLDILGSDDQSIRVAGTGGVEIPLAAIAHIQEVGFAEAVGSQVRAVVTFKPEFASLATLFSAPPSSEFGVLTVESDDPAAPLSATEFSEFADEATARYLANVGAGAGVGFGETDTFAEERALVPELAPENFPFPTMSLDIEIVRQFVRACMTSSPRVTYGLGAKVPFFRAVPGRDFLKVDCSGLVREAILRATNPRVAFPDGSVVQHDWIRANNFKRSTPASALLRDGAVRIAFLRPQDVSSRIGHVVLIQNAVTMESHGGVGPNMRPWTNTGWQALTYVYVLTPPTR